MPNHLVFVRHGQSEANIVQTADKDGYAHEMYETVSERPDWQQRLSQEGVEQAKIAGDWIRRNLGGVAAFDFRYNSPFIRARETAGYISGDDPSEWIFDDRVVERSWGIYGALTKAEREEMFSLTTKMYKLSPWYVKLEGGESRYEVSNRFRDFQSTLHREAADKKVIVVTHGDYMGIARYNLERMLPEEFEQMEHDRTQTIRNCNIMHYSRVNPEDPEDIREKIAWRRMTDPIDESRSPFGGEWVELPARRKYTGAELIGQAALVPHLLA